MARDLQAKVVVVTGGASGIGLAIADEFLQNGARVTVLLDINENLGADAVNELNTKHGINKSTFIKCDATMDLEKVTKEIIDTYKTVDVLVNNAGIVDETNPKRTIGLNAIAVIEWSLKYVEHMRTDRGGKGGTIINMSSIYGFMVDQYLPIYKASKYAVMGFTKTKGHKYHFDKTGVRLLVICPGATRTCLTNNFEMCEIEENRADFASYFPNLPWQDSKAVGVAAVEVFQKADSGTAWLIQGGESIEEV